MIKATEIIKSTEKEEETEDATIVKEARRENTVQNTKKREQKEYKMCQVQTNKLNQETIEMGLKL